MRQDKSHIFKRLDRIEEVTGNMIHEIPELSEVMRNWQNEMINDVYFYEFINKYWDSLHSDGVNLWRKF